MTEHASSLLLLPHALAPTALAQHILSSATAPWHIQALTSLTPLPLGTPGDPPTLLFPVISRIFWFFFSWSCPKARAAPWEGREPGLGSVGVRRGRCRDGHRATAPAQSHLFPVNGLSIKSAPNLLLG